MDVVKSSPVNNFELVLLKAEKWRRRRERGVDLWGEVADRIILCKKNIRNEDATLTLAHNVFIALMVDESANSTVFS